MKRLSALVLLVFPWLFASPAIADPSASPTSSASASASASASSPAAARPLAGMDLPSEPSAAPGKDDWKAAQAVSLDNELTPGCSALLLREWLRVRCKGSLPGSGAVVSGPSKEVLFYIGVPRDQHGFPNHGESFIDVVMPLRRGESRLVQLTRATTGGYDGPFSQGSWVLLSQEWRPQRKAPAVRADHRAWKRDELFGMRIGGVDEAKALGLKTAWSERIVLSVEPGSPADEGGAKPGDNLSGFFSGDWPERLALDDGAVFSMLVLRDGKEKMIYFPRRQGAKW